LLGINIGVDMGTTSIIIYVEDKGIVLSEPTVAAYRKSTGKIAAVGKKALRMVGRAPKSIEVVRPMKDGVISDFTAAEHILRHFLQKICGNMVFKPNVMICLPAQVTNLEKRTLLDLATSAGAARACLIEEPIAAAIGAGIDVTYPKGIMIVDVGGGTTDIAVITMGSMSVSKSVRNAGNALNESIMRQIRRERDILIGELTAEKIKKKIGCAYLREAELAIEARGKSYITGMPVRFEVTSTEVFLAIREHLESIAEDVRSVLESTPPELAADISESGIVMTGGGSLLHGFDEFLAKKMNIAVRVAEDPVNCVAKGIGKVLKNMEMLVNGGYIFKTRDDIRGYSDYTDGLLEGQ